MKKRKISLAILSLLAVGLMATLVYLWVSKVNDPLQSVSLWRGIYTENFENSSFQPCESKELSSSEGDWWTTGNLKEIRAVADKLNDFTPVYVEFTGQVSPKGTYGGLGAYSREITVKDVMKVQKEIPEECR